ncbi:hypothetical protein QLQ12_35215 [Actinoplanes sp. NEAU-A12]|uniref:Uncharacterized protein n=1 Tax=Actinoplanes sandaracinus TaxID=3045177 RepID=A0ABT6WVV9_9ACTN|nr:hypothetical protein [Actinoplanes sandaracinus]MDI6103878.1 hypothetical protein [Actinoplanes sandaracinus]
MSDEFPRPYAEEPPAPGSLSGLRLLRARPWALAATVLLTFLLVVAYPLLVLSLMRSGRYEWEVAPYLLYPIFTALPMVVPLTVVAVLARRRVTLARALGLLVVAMVLTIAPSMLISSLPPTIFGGGVEWLPFLLWPVIELLTLIVIGSLGATLFPPVAGRKDLGALVLTSVAVTALSVGQSWLRVPGAEPVSVTWSLAQAVLAVCWSIGALVTSPPAALAWAHDPAELGRQDP